jgi:hypothetical protein
VHRHFNIEWLDDREVSSNLSVVSLPYELDNGLGRLIIVFFHRLSDELREEERAMSSIETRALS